MSATKEDITFKKIVFMGNDTQHSYETNGGNVIVVGSTGTHDHGSSKVKLKNIVDYKWEIKPYVGRLIAVHISGEYLAYSIKVNSKDGKAEGMVRVVNPKTGQRALIRGMTNEVLDIQFANIKTQIVLASIEDIALHIHTIETVNNNIICTLLLKIEDVIPGHVPKYDKINWCPYVAENDDETDNYIGKLVIWTRGNNYQCYNVQTLIQNYGLGTHLANELTEGAIKQNESSQITGATLSPDGTTVAITFEDGNIRFYQVYFHTNEDAPRLLHQWIPHNGKPVSTLLFLDDHSKYSEDNSLWKYAITTSDSNTEIKVWCCATWECTQTIKFQTVSEQELYFNAEIDPTSSYLVLTDTISRCLYVLQILQSNADDAISKNENSDISSKKAIEGGETDAKSQSSAFIKSISEFPLSSPILSFGIMNATVRKYKCAYNDVYLLEELDDYDEDNLNRYCVVIHLYLVQPKSVQECHVLYQPSLSIASEVGSSLSALSEDAADRESEILNEVKPATNDNLDNNAVSVATSTATTDLLKSPSSLIKSDSIVAEETIQPTVASVPVSKPTPITLMTPDSFHSSGKITPEGVSNEVYSTLRMLAGEKLPESVNLLHLVNNKVIEEQEKLKYTQQQQQQSNVEKVKSDVSTGDRSSVESDTNKNAPQPIVPPMPPSSMLAAAGVSGGSSPSREVQEILSKDSDLLDEFYDEINVGDDTDGSGNNHDAPDGNENDEEEEDDEEKNSNPDDDETYVAANNVNDTDLYVNPSCLENENKSQPQSNGLRKQSKTEWPNIPDLSTLPNINSGLLQKTSTPINDINSKLDQLLDIVQSQNCQITELRSELSELKKARTDTQVSSATSEANITKMEFRLSKMIEEYLVRYDREHNKKLETFLAGREKQNRELRDNIIHALTPLVCNQLSKQLSNILTNEIQKHVMPIIAGKLEGIKTQIQSDISQKITITDHVIKENITNICRSKDTLEIFGNAVTNGVRSGMHQTYTDTLRKVILPSYEKANAELFKQLYETFNEGAISYSNQIMAYTKSFEPLLKELANFMHSVPQQLQDISIKTVNSCMDKVGADITKDLKAIQANMLKTTRDNIKSEIQKGFESQAASLEDSVLMAVRSQAQTPAPGLYDTQEQIKYLLFQGQINKAFHQALLANDLNLVEFTLSKADYNQVFNPCPLEQTVLLSLIQQISADMSNHNELKHKYLSNGILNLNLHDPVTKEHSPNVLRELQVNCQNYIMSNPQTPLSSSVRMLMMAIQGLGLNLM